MATVIRLKGVNFNNPSLPVIAPLVRTGLRAAWRPAIGDESLVDLSGNGHALTKIGNPTFTDKSISGDRNNGLLSDLIETTSYTYMVVAKIPDGVDATKEQPLVFNNFTDDNNLIKGGAVWLSAGGIKSAAAYYSSGASDNDQDNSVLGTASGIGNDWQFIVVQVDSTAGTQRVYAPTIRGNFSADERSGLDFSGRTLYADLTLSIIATPYDVWNSLSRSEVGEVLVYDRALSVDDVQRQYELSKDFWKNPRGIDI